MSVDIVNLIESNPITKLTGNYQSKLVEKVQKTFNNYEQQISQLSDENNNLQVSFAESSFLGQAIEKIQGLNFQKTTAVKYIQIPANSVAIAK